MLKYNFFEAKLLFTLALLISLSPLTGQAGALLSAPSGENIAINLSESLEAMGYSEIEITACEIKFERLLENECPSDRALSYVREIDLDNLNMKSTSEVVTRDSNNRVFYEFSVNASQEYSMRAVPILAFRRKIKETFPESGWPFRFDETLPQIRILFAEAFPHDANFNLLIPKTCFGESPLVYQKFWMSFDDKLLLEEFREALINHAEHFGCGN